MLGCHTDLAEWVTASSVLLHGLHCHLPARGQSSATPQEQSLLLPPIPTSSPSPGAAKLWHLLGFVQPDSPRDGDLHKQSHLTLNEVFPLITRFSL